MHSSIRRASRRFRYHILSRRAWRHRLVFWAGAVVVGVTCFVFVQGGQFLETRFRQLMMGAPWLPFLITPAGLAAAAWLTRRFFAGAEGSGIPQVVAAIQLPDRIRRGRLLSLRIAVGKIGLTWLALICGGSVGVFAPTVHIGASLLYGFGDRSGIRRHHIHRGLILAGGAAGIAAAFNTPLAGIVFAIEQMSRSIEERSSGLMLSAVIIAGITALVLAGNYQMLPAVESQLTDAVDWLAVPTLGISGGLLGAFFGLVLIVTSCKVAPWLAQRGIVIALLCGLIVALCGWATAGLTHGTGFQQARELAAGELSVTFLFPLAKMIATLASYLSGVPAGIFGPALGIGAGVGSAFAAWFPHVDTTVLVLLGMVAFFSGMAQTPITAFVVIMEMSDHHALLLPLMTTAFLAYIVSRAVCRKPIYLALAEPFLNPPQRH